MDVRPVDIIAGAIQGLDSHSIYAISLALDLLKITVSQWKSETNIKPRKLSLPLGKTDVKNGPSYVEFDLDSQQWILEPSSMDPGPSSQQISVRSDSLHDPGPAQTLLKLEVVHGKKLNTTQEEVDYDWTLLIPRTEHNNLLLNKDWENTPLGPMRKWSLPLRLMTLKMLADPRPANLYWGKDRIAIYNAPFAITACSRHPAMLGARAEDSLPATWPFLGPMMEEVERSGNAFSLPEFEMEVHKESGFLEEAWYDGLFSPITNPENGKFLGLYNSGYEITDAVLMHRYNRLAHQINETPDFNRKTPWKHILDVCESFQRDVPMMIIYSADVEETTRSNRCILRLEGSLGLPCGHIAIPKTFDLDKATENFAPAFRSSKEQESPVLLDMPEGKLPSFLHGIEWRGWKEPSTHVVVIPIFVTGLIAGFIAMGLNPRRPYNDGLKQLVNDIRTVSTGITTSSISFDQAREREKLLTKELTEREKFIRKLAEVSTVGIYSISQAGALTYANSRYYNILGTSEESRNKQETDLWNCIMEDDRSIVAAALAECKAQKSNASINIRLKAQWTPPGTSTQEHRWVLNSIIPDVVGDEVQGVIGSLTDVSHTMWALKLQKELTQSAMESKRQQERFIDMTSHEMRNPLSAMFQCADDIFRSIDNGKLLYGRKEDLEKFMEDMRENAKTILFCTTHQKKIVDDILTFSKLDSSLLTIVPVLVEPAMVAKGVVKMFQAEASTLDVHLSFITDKTYDVTWVHCDPLRLRQVLINFIANALKFTKESEKREVKLIIGACTAAPPTHMNTLNWHSKKDQSPPKPCINDEVFLTFQVQDTGQGLTEEEMSRLFNRFSQASPATSVTYGGSGLGLFISKTLTELQGGQVGIASKPGKGSDFGFYIKAEKATAKKSETETVSLKAASRSSSQQVKSASEQYYDILMVEDNVLNQKVLSKQLRKLGHQVTIANHGVEALEFLRTTQYWSNNKGIGAHLDVILMDWEMPIMNGLEATRQIREMEKNGSITEHLTIIATTANTREEQKQEGHKAGMDKFLAKPFTASQVVAMMKSDS